MTYYGTDLVSSNSVARLRIEKASLTSSSVYLHENLIIFGVRDWNLDADLARLSIELTLPSLFQTTLHLLSLILCNGERLTGVLLGICFCHANIVFGMPELAIFVVVISVCEITSAFYLLGKLGFLKFARH